MRIAMGAAVGLATTLMLGGCPQGAPTEFISGSSGQNTQIGTTASVQVFAPVNDLTIPSGTPVEVNWSVVATSRNSTINVIFDVDNNPTNGNETLAISGLSINTNSQVLDTTRLRAGTYLVGVVLINAGATEAFGYAAGRITINQAPQLFFTSPRDNFRFDRTTGIVPRFDVAWTLNDPDTTVSVEIFLDPDNSPNGNEIPLRESNSQTGDSFSFDLPTANFEPGTYRILAIITEQGGVNQFPVYAPGTILIRARLAGIVDLRDLDLPTGGVSGAVFEGFNPRDNAGSFVASMKDIDGDGFDDFIIFSQFAKPYYQFNTSRTGVGEAYIIYGNQDRFSGKLNLNSTGTLFRGEICAGPPEAADPIRPSRGITSFALLSDWDGDGVQEMAFGCPFTDSLSVESVVDTDAPLDVDAYFRSGVVVVGAGASLRPDLGFPGRQVMNLAAFGTLVHTPCPGTTTACPEGFYGPKAAPSPGGATTYHLHLSCAGGVPNAGSIRLGCRFSSNDLFDMFGETVAAWDFDSLAVAAPNRDPVVSIRSAGQSVPGAGVISVFFCDVKSGFFPWTGVQAPPAAPEFNYPGMPLGPVVSLPHGGPYHYIVDDLRLFNSAVGPQTGSPGFVVDENDGTPCFDNPLNDARIQTPDFTVRFWSNKQGAALSNVRALNDFNADGLPDLAIGMPIADNGRGACFLIFGRLRDIVRSGELQLEELGLPENGPDGNGTRIFDGIRVVGGAGDRLGQSQDSAGDFNGDGLADVVIGSPFINNRQGGAAIFFGSRDVINLTETEIPFNELPDRGLGIIFVGEKEGDLAGARVAGCGDIDGDGNDDILIAAPNRSVTADTDLDGAIEIDRANCGVVYLIYGSPDLKGTLNLADVGTEALPGAVFVGRRSGDFLGAGIGEQGDRSFGISGAGDVDGDGINDLLFGSVSAAPRDRARAGETYLIYGRGD